MIWYEHDFNLNKLCLARINKTRKTFRVSEVEFNIVFWGCSFIQPTQVSTNSSAHKKRFLIDFFLGHKSFQFQQNLFQQNIMWMSFSIVRAARMLIKFYRLWFSKISYFGDKTYPSNDFFSIWKWSIWKKKFAIKFPFPSKSFQFHFQGFSIWTDTHSTGEVTEAVSSPNTAFQISRTRFSNDPLFQIILPANTFVHKIKQLIFREILL